MKIIKNLNGTNLEIALEGRLDTTTAPELEKELEDSVNAANELTLDLEKLDYISSALGAQDHEPQRRHEGCEPQ